MRSHSTLQMTAVVGLVFVLAAALAAVVFLNSADNPPKAGGPISEVSIQPTQQLAALPAPSAQVGTQMNTTLPSALLHLKLVDSRGQTHQLADYAGKVVVISDEMTLCQQTCPLDTTTVTQIARAVDAAGLGKQVVFLSITVDPQRDTPAQLAAYRKLFTPVPSNWLTLTGSSGAIDSLWHTLGVYLQRVPDKPPLPTNWRTGQKLHYDIDHSDEVFFIDASGHERFVLEGVPHVNSVAAIPKKLYDYLNAKGRQGAAHPKSTAWTEAQALQVISWLTQHEVS
ncbi:MAG: SCO family protein [Nocardioidaceae bacterium]